MLFTADSAEALQPWAPKIVIVGDIFDNLALRISLTVKESLLSPSPFLFLLAFQATLGQIDLIALDLCHFISLEFLL